MTSSKRQIDKLPPRTTTREMKVLCLSAPRSGSTSMGQALKMLDYNIFAGMAHNYLQDNRFQMWSEAVEARYNGKGKPFTKDDFEKFLGPYDAVSGWGAAMLAEDLFTAYPDAKVILTTRDPDKWVESWDGSVVHIHKWWQKWWWILPLCGGKERDFRSNAETSLYAWSNEDPFDRSEQRSMYVNHNKRVREIVPREQLLEFNVEGDWKRLCEFLGKNVPNQPYPHGGDRQNFHTDMNMLWRLAFARAMLRVIGALGVSAILLLFVLRYWRKVSTARLVERLRKGSLR